MKDSNLRKKSSNKKFFFAIMELFYLFRCLSMYIDHESVITEMYLLVGSKFKKNESTDMQLSKGLFHHISIDYCGG